MKPMCAAQVLRRFTFEEWGGIETVVWNSSRYLKRADVENEILCTSALAPELFEEVEGIAIRRFPYLYPHLFLTESNQLTLDKKGGDPYSVGLFQALVKNRRLSIIHCHTMNRIANQVRLAAKYLGIPYIVSFHGGHFDVPHGEIQEMLKPYRGTLNLGRLMDHALSKEKYLDDADAIVCVGNNEFELAQQRFPGKLVFYLPNGVEPANFEGEVSVDIRKKYRIAPDKKVILCLSRIDYQKNQVMLIDLMNALKLRGDQEYHLLLVGPVTSASYYARLTDAIREYGLESKVTIIEGLRPDSPYLKSAYRSSDLFVLPSLHEPFGIVALEAWASGLPLVCAQVGGLKKIVTDGETGLFFQPGEIDTLLHGLDRLTDNPRLRSKLIAAGRQEVETTYSWRQVTGELIDIYEQVMDAHRG